MGKGLALIHLTGGCCEEWNATSAELTSHPKHPDGTGQVEPGHCGASWACIPGHRSTDRTVRRTTNARVASRSATRPRARQRFGEDQPQVSGVRTGWPVGRVLYAEAWRPSIYDDRCRPPPAIYPRTRAGSPQTCAHPVPEGTELLDLAPGGVCLAGQVAPAAGGLLHRRFILTAPRRSEGRRSFFCGTVPQVAPGGCYPPPCPVEPGPSSAPCSLSVAR